MAAVPVIAADPVPVKVKIPFAATVIKEGGRYLIQVPARPGQIYCLEVPDGSGGMTFAGVPGTAIYAQSDTVRWPLELAGTVVGAEEEGNSAGVAAGASPPAAGGTVLLPLTIEVSESQGTHVRLRVDGANPWVAVAAMAFPRVTFEGFADLPTATGVRCTALSTRVVTAPIGDTEPGRAALTLEQQQEFDAILAGLPQLIAAATLPPGATPAIGTGGTSPLAAARYFRVAMYVVDSNGNGFADADELAGRMNPFARPGEPGYVNATDAGDNGVGGMSPIWDRDEDFSPDFEEIAAGTSLSEKLYAPVVLTCQTFDRRADFDSSGSWREIEDRIVGWERHWDGFNEEMLSWSPPSLLVRTTPRTLAGFMSDFADGWENPDPESGKGLPPRSLFEEYFMFPALIARRVRPAAGVAGNPEATSGYIRAIGARYRLRGPLSSEDQHRQFLKVTWTQTSGFEQVHDLEYAAWSLMGQPLLEQAPTSVEVVTLTIPRGSLYSDPPYDVVPQYSAPQGSANPEMLHSQVGEYLKVVRLLPVEFKTYPDTKAGPDKAHKLNLTTRQGEKAFYGQRWEKCVSKVWATSNTVNLIDYLDGGAGNHATYENVVKWKVNGTEQDSHELSLGSEPGEDAHRRYYIEILPKNGGDTIDRLVITLIPRSTKTSFDNWYTTEKADLAWLGELVNLFSSFSTILQPNGYYRRPDRNFNPFLYAVPGDSNTRMHPDAYFEARSFATAGGHAHQMCFKADGTLLRFGVSAGSADKAAAFPQNLNPFLHLDADVKPFVWALQLDGTPADRQGTTLSAPIMHEGVNLKKYSECRPAIANGKTILVDGAMP